MTAPTTRETADHIGEANEKVTADHAELARRFEALAVEASAARNLDGAESMMVSIQDIYDLIASRNALLSEIAALRGERDKEKRDADNIGSACDKLRILHRDERLDLMRRATQAERQRDELRKALEQLMRGYVNLLEIGRDRIVMLGGECDPVDVMEESDPALVAARNALANQGADQ